MCIRDSIEAGKVGTVIVKDMSRLGRNYLQVGMYTEMIFPQKGVRFIAINDGVDSAQGDNDFAPLRNIFNEWLVRDASKKMRVVKRSKGMNGKPITSKPVYGYLMDKNENFIIDEEAAPIVKQIYNLDVYKRQDRVQSGKLRGRPCRLHRQNTSTVQAWSAG